MKRSLSRLPGLLPVVVAATALVGCATDEFRLPGLDNVAPSYPYGHGSPGPGQVPYFYGYYSPFGDPWWLHYGYDTWPPRYYGYGGPYSYGYGHGYGPGYGYWQHPSVPAVRPCQDANGNGRCDEHPNRPPPPPREPARPGGIPGDVTPPPPYPGAPPPPLLRGREDRPQGPGDTPRGLRGERESRPPVPKIDAREDGRAPGSRRSPQPDDALPER